MFKYFISLVFLLSIPACQFTYSEVNTTNLIEENAQVDNSTQSGDIEPAVSRGGNTVSPTSTLDLAP